ncbi:MAG TPA: DUF5107 domain-containing protein [Kribbellaceae bacterium]
MPSTLTCDTLRVASDTPGPLSPLPMLRSEGLELVRAANPDPDPGLPPSLLPYHAYDAYTRDLRETDHAAVVLENEHLRATFLPGLGGRLWSLVDLRTGRELLHAPDAIRPGNLALRNAWFAGGVEWNLGTTGHWPLTCSPVHAGRLTAPDGTPVLRMWELERMRRLVWRIDAWLPAGSPVLFVRPRLHNPHATAVPMYWWSNIAVPQTTGVRVLVPATEAVTIQYDETLRLRPVAFPGTDPDLSRPAGIPGAADHFFDLRAAERPWIAAVDPDGYGLAQTSTARLWSRKVFRWGNAAGGERWQEWLSGDGRYLEIQAGLAHTQLDHVPLAPGETFAWTEAYGAVRAEPSRVHGDWTGATGALGDALAGVVPAEVLAAADAAAQGWAGTAPEAVLHGGSGWGALAVETGELPDDPGTPFGADTIGPEQVPWQAFWRTGRLPASEPPAATETAPVWEALLDKTLLDEDWHGLLHKGFQRFAAADPAGARDAWERSLAARPTAWSLRGLAELDRSERDTARAAGRLLQAQGLAPDCAPLIVEALAALVGAGRAAEALEVVDNLSAEQRRLGRVRLYECQAAIALGDGDRAGAILEDGLALADLREGDDVLERLWEDYQRCVGGAAPLPAAYDFRMHG